MDNYLSEIVDKIVDIADPDKIILFGSRAKRIKEDATFLDDGKSDYDICVLKTGIKSKREFAFKIYNGLLGVKALVPVDVIVETPERFEKLKENKFLIYKQISQYGVIIYERRKTIP